MGKGGGGEPNIQTVQPALPSIPGLSRLQGQAQNRADAGSPWINSPWRAMDMVAGSAPTQYLPQFTPQGATVGGATGGATQAYGPSTFAPGGGLAGFGFGAGGGSPMQMPGTATGQQAILGNVNPGLLGIMQFLSQLSSQSTGGGAGAGGQQAGNGGLQQTPVQQPPAPAAGGSSSGGSGQGSGGSQPTQKDEPKPAQPAQTAYQSGAPLRPDQVPMHSWQYDQYAASHMNPAQQAMAQQAQQFRPLTVQNGQFGVGG